MAALIAQLITTGVFLTYLYMQKKRKKDVNRSKKTKVTLCSADICNPDPLQYR